MSTYRSNSSMHLTQTEVPIYGSSRLGEYKPNVDVSVSYPVTAVTNTVFYRGEKNYELDDHRGNVYVVVSDKKIPQPNYNNTKDSFYLADVVNAQDYYAFGSLEPGRTFRQSSYRYSVNGQEKSLEIDTFGNFTDAKYWEYDSRILRRWNLEVNPNPSISDYATFLNNPILNSDPSGAEPRPGNNGGAPSPSLWDVFIGIIKANIGIGSSHSQSNTSSSNDQIDAQQAATQYTNNIVTKAQPVIKVVNQVKSVVAGFTPGGSSYEELKKGNYLMAAVYGVVDLFGGEIEKGVGKSISELGLKDGIKIDWAEGLEKAEQFLGKGYKEVEPGRFVSANGMKQVRMGEHELNSSAETHLNFETMKKNPKKPGKLTRDVNIHVYLKQ